MFRRTIIWSTSLAASATLCSATLLPGVAQDSKPTRLVGTIQALSEKSLTVLADAGGATPVSVDDGTKFLQIEPGKTDLKDAAPIPFSDLRAGDRVLVRGVLAEDGKTLRAASIIAVRKAAIADKQAKERAEWQRGVGGLVKSADAAAQAILITTNGFSANKEVLIHVGKSTALRRYASDSIRFDAAKPAPLSEIQPGDQLRARGTRTAEGQEFDAAEIVTGSFRSIAGTISSTEPASGSLVVQDLATKTPVTLKITSESQMRKLPAQFAEGLAARLKGQPAGQPGAASGAAPQPAAPGAPASQPQGAPNGSANGAAAGGGPNGARGGDFQQMIARMPAASLSDLQKGEAIMVVTTQGNGKDPLTVITLLGGVEAILRASPKGGQDMILSPWSLGGGEPSGN